MSSTYPDQPRARERWILARRGPREPLDPLRPHSFLLEDERNESGEVVSVATIFLTNRECPWRCLMCDLWKQTLTESVPVGAIPQQIDFALGELRAKESAAGQVRQIKLYNSGSFFDPRAIPPEDHPAIAERVCSFDRVIVECHPALVNVSCLRFRDRLDGELEVALGLETAHPGVLEKLNKRLTPEQFSRAAKFLRRNGIALRVFVLVKPPFLGEADALEWVKRSIDFAFECGTGVVSLIPTRLGNGAMEALAAAGEFSPPRLATLEAALAYGIDQNRGRVFGDTWDLENFSNCPGCFAARAIRLREMNLRQVTLPPIRCQVCES